MCAYVWLPCHTRTHRHMLSPQAHSPARTNILSCVDLCPHMHSLGRQALSPGHKAGTWGLPGRAASCTDVLSHLNLIQAGGRVEGLTSALIAALCRPRIHLGHSLCQAITTTAAQQLSFTGFLRGGPSSEPHMGVHSFPPHNHWLRELRLLVTPFCR